MLIAKILAAARRAAPAPHRSLPYRRTVLSPFHPNLPLPTNVVYSLPTVISVTDSLPSPARIRALFLLRTRVRLVRMLMRGRCERW